MAMSGTHTDGPSRLGRLTAPVRTRMHLVRYAAFAVAAIVVNLLCQNVVLMLCSGLWIGIYFAIAVGTGAGLLFKYVCDKYWVFKDLDASVASNSRKFAGLANETLLRDSELEVSRYKTTYLPSTLANTSAASTLV